MELTDEEKKIQIEVEDIIREDLKKLEKVSGELKIGEKEYLVIPDEEAEFSGFIPRAIELTIKKLRKSK